MKTLRTLAAACAAMMALTFVGSVCPEQVHILPDVSITASAASAVWDGTSDISWYDESQNSFEISTAEQLAGLSQLVRNGHNMSGKLITLTNDIVLNDTSNFANWDEEPPENLWIPIGALPMASPSAPTIFGNPNDSGCVIFAGVFDGGGHTIKGMYAKHDCLAGLFASVSGGVFRTIVEDGYVYCETPSDTSWIAHAGGIAAHSEQGIFNQCEFNGKVYAVRRGYPTFRNAPCAAGGIVGECEDAGMDWLLSSLVLGAFLGVIINPLLFLASSDSTIQSQGIYNCINRGTISTEGGNAGGILGHGNTGDALAHTLVVRNCYNEGVVDNGIVGLGYRFTVSNCFYTNAEQSVTSPGGMDLDDSTNFTEVGKSKQEVAEDLGKLFKYENDGVYLDFNPDIVPPETEPSEPTEEPTETEPPTEATEPSETLPPIVLDAPKNFTHGVPSGNIKLSWDPVENATGYQVQIAAKADFNDIVFDKASGNSIRIDNLRQNRIYKIRVRAYADRAEDGQRFYSDWSVYDYIYAPTVTVWGDVNDDGEFSVMDVILFQKWLLSPSGVKLPNWKAADYVTDNQLDIYDLALMKQCLVNEQANPGRYWIVYREGYGAPIQMVRFDMDEADRELYRAIWDWVACDWTIGPCTKYTFDGSEWQKTEVLGSNWRITAGVVIASNLAVEDRLVGYIGTKMDKIPTASDLKPYFNANEKSVED